MSASENLPYLSIVVTSRNDDHGGDPLRRTQIFLNGLFEQCLKYRLPAELIFVEWNPPPDRPRLYEALSWQKQNEYCPVRVICVPPQLHNRFKHSAKLSLYQMIAKNVGIRRAYGKFVLATNIDILFSNELMAFLTQQQLTSDCMYRVDRFDVPNTIALDATVDTQLDFCWKNRIRLNFRGQTLSSNDCLGTMDRIVACARMVSAIHLPVAAALLNDIAKGDTYTVQREVPAERLHTNACGDFTLLSKEKWDALHGYPEFDAFSMHIDSLFCYMAHYGRVLETLIPPPAATFHIEHAVGSGWSPEGGKALFERIEKAEIPCLDYGLIQDLGEKMRKEGEAIIFNSETWGLYGFQLEEVSITEGRVSGPDSPFAVSDTSAPPTVSSLSSDHRLEKLQIKYLKKENRRLETELKETVAAWKERGAWIEELEKAKDWYEGNRVALEAELKTAIEAWKERGAWIEELEKNKQQ